MRNIFSVAAGVVAVALAGVAGCSEPDSPRDRSEAADGLPEDAGAHILDNGKVKGTLEVGERDVAYTAKPEFWLFELTASKGDLVSLTASSAEGGGDPILWLLDGDAMLLAKNDDAFGGSGDAELFHKIEQDGVYIVALADIFRRPAAFTLALAGASSPDPADLEKFLALSDAKKLDRLYTQFDDFGEGSFDADLAAEFSRTSLQIVDEVEGPAKKALLDAFFALRDDCLDQGGTIPDVSALRHGGLIYAVEMTCVEDNEDVEWEFLQVLDAKGKLLGSLGQIGF